MHIEENKEASKESTLIIINGEKVSYEKILLANPQYFGDKESPAFMRAMVKHYLRDYLLAHSNKGKTAAKSDVYQYLRDALYHELIVHDFLENKYSEISFQEEDLYSFYEKNRDAYVKGEQWLINVFRMRYNPEDLQDPYEQHLARKKAWENIREIRETYTEAMGNMSEKLDALQKKPGFQFIKAEKWRTTGELGSLIGKDIAQRQKGEISPILIGTNAYVFYHIIDHKEKEYYHFKDILPRIRRDYITAYRTSIRTTHGLEHPADAAATFELP